MCNKFLNFSFFNLFLLILKLPGTETSNSSGSSVVGIVVGCIFGIISFIVIIGVGFFCFRKFRLKESNY